MRVLLTIKNKKEVLQEMLSVKAFEKMFNFNEIDMRKTIIRFVD